MSVHLTHTHTHQSQTQEEVTSLQNELKEAVKRVELTRSTLTTTHISATARMSSANDSLLAEVQELEVRGERSFKSKNCWLVDHR